MYCHDANNNTNNFNLDALAHTLAVLGTLPSSTTPSEPLRAIVRFERTALSSTVASQLSSGILESTKQIGSTDIVCPILFLSPKH
jgi:hypothetical protein